MALPPTKPQLPSIFIITQSMISSRPAAQTTMLAGLLNLQGPSLTGDGELVSAGVAIKGEARLGAAHRVIMRWEQGLPEIAEIPRLVDRFLLAEDGLAGRDFDTTIVPLR